MGLYLCIFSGDEEVDGVEVGMYSDFARLREAVQECLEQGRLGSRFPTLQLHSDCDGEWSPEEAGRLAGELGVIAIELRDWAPVELGSAWQIKLAKELAIRPTSLLDCFFDVDGEPLIERLMSLCKIAVDRHLPILFQ